MDRFNGKTVVITGACGTVGGELVRQLVAMPDVSIIALDNNESELFFQQEQFRRTGRVQCYLADIRDPDALTMRFQGADVVLHSAALKHVGLCEQSPTEAVRTNINGTQNVINAALANQVERVIFTSSDKAVNPTNVMGTTKLMGERLMTAASESNTGSRTVFASTRFGNVLGSRGSVVPLFKRQIAKGGPITLTDKKMTRFVMTLEEAARLVLNSVWLAQGGEVMVTKMPVARIEDIAIAMRDGAAQANSVKIVEIGAKPGEKMYEELMNDEEVRRTKELGDYFVILPAFADKDAAIYDYLKGCAAPDRPYHSSYEPAMNQQGVAAYLGDSKLLD